MNRPDIPRPGDEPGLPVGRSRALAPVDGVTAEEVTDQESLDFATVWRIVWERRVLILGGTLLGLLLALVYSLLQPPNYRSTATLELNPPTIPILSTNGKGDQDLVVPQTDYEFLATQYGLLNSKSLAVQVINDLKLGGLAKLPVGERVARTDALADQILENFQVEPVKQSRLVTLAYTSEKASESARIVNGFADAFIKSTLERRYDAAATARDFLQKRLTSVQGKLEDSERKLVDYAQKNGIIKTGDNDTGDSDTDNLQGASLIALNQALAQAQQQRIAAEEQYRNMSGSGTAAEVSQSTAPLRQQKAQLEAEYSEKSTYLKNDYPEMVRLRSQIQALDKAISQEAGTVSSSRASTLKAQYEAALQEEQKLQGKVSQLKAAVLNLRERSIQYKILERQVDTNRSLYEALLARYNEIGVAGGINTPQALLVDPGAVPKFPYSPNIPRNSLLGALIGLVLGLLIAFALHYVMDRISTPEDIREKLKLTPLGVIPRKKRGEELARTIADRRSAISEAYASLVTTLQFTSSKGMPHTLLVTSTIAEEGKSTTSFAIARLLAQHGNRVLLLDADLRKPSFIVEESRDIGFSQLVLEGGEIAGHVLKTNEENLWLMPSGPPPPNPVQVLNSVFASRVIEETRNLFDFVIIDAPPTHGFADAPLLAAMCDAVLLVIESGKTRRRPAIDAIQRLSTTGAQIVGAALTKYRFEVNDYGYRYYSSYREEAGALAAHELAVGLIKHDET